MSAAPFLLSSPCGWKISKGQCMELERNSEVLLFQMSLVDWPEDSRRDKPLRTESIDFVDIGSSISNLAMVFLGLWLSAVDELEDPSLEACVAAPAFADKIFLNIIGLVEKIVGEACQDKVLETRGGGTDVVGSAKGARGFGGPF